MGYSRGGEIEPHLEHMARNGMNVLRVFIVSDIENEARGGTNAGVLEPVIGEGDEREWWNRGVWRNGARRSRGRARNGADAVGNSNGRDHERLS